MNFEECINYILEFEGGYTWDEHDPGGETNFGIDRASHPDINIKNLTRQDAIDIYKSEYWIKGDCDLVPEAVRFAYFDSCVNEGLYRARKMLQKAIGVQSDGIFGPTTRLKFQALSNGSKDAQSGVLTSFLSNRMQHYGSLTSFNYFGAGWSNRLWMVGELSFKEIWSK